MSLDLLIYVGSGCCCLLVGLVVLVLLIVIARKLLSPDEAENQWMVDARDPRKRWAQGAFFLLTSQQDYAYLADGQVRVMLEDAWGIADATQLEATVQQLETSLGGAWDLVRAMLLARSAVAVGFMDDATSWERVRRQSAALQQTYEDWQPMADHLVASRRAWLGTPDDGSGDDDDMKAVLTDIGDVASTIWPKTPFKGTALT